MCGILGIAGAAPVRERSWLRAGSEALHHRGPDDAGEWWSEDGCVGLGHRRLAIIDLSPSGHQPMVGANGDTVLVFNGEIYNFTDLRQELGTRGHTLRSQSDTEVLLAAYHEWSVDCLSRLNGIFAFAIYDARTRQVFMARDRAGEKPLYYTVAGRALRFASELKALLADPAMSRRIDRGALDCYLAMGFAPGERCMIEGVRKLPPAHALVFDLATGDVRRWRYWQLPSFEQSGASEMDLVDELDSLLADSVKRQLVADVPVGVLLSGGVDSSVVTAMAARATPRVKTFTIRFPDDRKFDETEHARLIARHFGTDHIELEAEQSTIDLLPQLVHQFDEPVVDSSMIPTYLVSRLTRQHCTVALGGDGGDELFGGYRAYNRLIWRQQKLAWMPRPLSRAIAHGADVLLPTGFRGRIRLQALEADLEHSLPLGTFYFDRRARRALLGSAWPLIAEHAWQERVPCTEDIVRRATHMDLENYLAEDVLVKVDRASMLSSLEVRAPLLDYRIIDFSFRRVPSHLKATLTTRKVLLKQLASRVLPPEFDQHRKQGFAAPLASWLQTPAWQKLLRDVLLAPSDAMFDRGTVQRLLRGQSIGMLNSERLFALLMAELWRREYRLTL